MIAHLGNRQLCGIQNLSIWSKLWCKLIPFSTETHLQKTHTPTYIYTCGHPHCKPKLASMNFWKNEQKESVEALLKVVDSLTNKTCQFVPVGLMLQPHFLFLERRSYDSDTSFSERNFNVMANHRNRQLSEIQNLPICCSRALCHIAQTKINIISNAVSTKPTWFIKWEPTLSITLPCQQLGHDKTITLRDVACIWHWPLSPLDTHMQASTSHIVSST